MWYVSNGTNGGKIYTVVNGIVYYLTIGGDDLAVTYQVTPDAAPVWSESAGNSLTMVQDLISYTIDGTTYYLAVNAGANGFSSPTEPNAATKWTVTTTGSGTTISTVIDGTTYYVGYNIINEQTGFWATVSYSGPRLVTGASGDIGITWQRTNNQFYVVGSRGYGTPPNYYLRLNDNNNNWTIDTGNQNLDLNDTESTPIAIAQANTDEVFFEITHTEDSRVDNALENGYYDSTGKWVSTPDPNSNISDAGVTYFPLSFEADVANNSYKIKENNTGYIISAEWGVLKTDDTFEHDQYGNVRIASYSLTGTGMGTNSQNWSNYNYETPYTITYKTGGKFKTISEIAREKNQLTSAQKEMLAGLGLEKYADCYKNYVLSIEQNNAASGIHFMRASVSEENTTRITAYLKGEPYEGYEVPTNCIDFHLYDRGFINFAAGSYYTAENPANNSFFSIYEIIREPNDPLSIKEIKEISAIYAMVEGTGSNKQIVTTEKYIYAYVGEETPELSTGYEMVFDCRWITHPNDTSFYGSDSKVGPTAWANTRAFYFEVPVNAGEYAIGSTKDRTGAYLVYLDLAANAQLYERTKDYEEITEGATDATVPQGVDWLTAKPTGEDDDTLANAIDPMNSAFVSITTDTSGNIVFKRVDATVTYTAPDGVLPGYIGINNTLIGNGNSMATTPGETTVIERTSYRDFNLTKKETRITVIDKITVGTSVTYSKRVTLYSTDANGNPVETLEFEKLGSAEPLTPDTPDPNPLPDGVPSAAFYKGLDDAENAATLINLGFVYAEEDTVAASYLYTPAVKDENGTVTAPAEYLITVTNTGTDAITCKATLTAAGARSGIVFKITDGTTVTTLTSSKEPQTVSINTTTEAEQQ